MFCEKTKVFFSKHFSLNFLADLMHKLSFEKKVDKMSFHISQIPETHCS